eukprot:SM000110S18882  [mRNA]  locus=s110:46813:47822:- [translate_table: standard]
MMPTPGTDIGHQAHEGGTVKTDSKRRLYSSSSLSKNPKKENWGSSVANIQLRPTYETPAEAAGSSSGKSVTLSRHYAEAGNIEKSHLHLPCANVAIESLREVQASISKGPRRCVPAQFLKLTNLSALSCPRSE